MAGYGIGAVGGGLLMLRLRPPRPLLVAVIASLGWACPPAALAAGLPLAVACLGAVVAGVGGSVYGTLSSTVIQRAIPLEFQGRVAAWTGLGAFVLGPVGLAGAGPLAQVLGLATVLALGPLWLLVAVAAMTAVPSVRLRNP